jgi:cobalamin biosynthesis Mg chelatase CobN
MACLHATKDGVMNLPEEPTESAAAQAGAGPDDVQQLEAQIERTREQLGATVDQLAAKVDVKSRARAKAAELAERAKATGQAGQAKAAELAGQAKATGQAKAAELAGRAKATGQAGQAKATELSGRATGAAKSVTTGIREQASTERMRQVAAKGASTARERPVPLAVAAAVLVAAYLVIRQWRKR